MTPQEKLNTVWPFPSTQPVEGKPIPVITGARDSDYVDTINLATTATGYNTSSIITSTGSNGTTSTSLPIDWSNITINTPAHHAVPFKINATDQVLDERAKNYGTFTGIGKLTQTFKEQLRAAPTWRNMQPDQRESLDMIVHKMARILNGNCDYADSWVDIAGYARLVADRLEKGVER